MADIKNIAIHHAGGLGNDQYASTKHLTVDAIDNAHRARWDFPSAYMRRETNMTVAPWYFGYNVIYDPKDRKFTQGRAIGEETAAQYGYNFDTFSVCIIGNYMRVPMSNPSRSVDPVTKQIEEDITLFLFDLINGNKRNLKVVPGTKVELAIARVQPHRFYGPTDCYGTFISDSRFRDLLVAYKPMPLTPQPPVNSNISTSTALLVKRDGLTKLILELVLALADFLQALRETPLGRSDSDRSCSGFIN